MRRLISMYALLLITVYVSVAYGATQFDFLLAQVRTSTTSLAGGKVYFYATGTTIPKTVWLDRNQVAIAANPYTLDANGTAQLYGSGLYRVVIKDATGVTKYDRDGITTAGTDGTVTPLAGSASPVVLPSGGRACYMKTDNSVTTVLLNPGAGTTIMGLDSYEIYLQYETACFSLSSSVWVRE